jgi:prophage regulatory protein
VYCPKIERVNQTRTVVPVLSRHFQLNSLHAFPICDVLLAFEECLVRTLHQEVCDMNDFKAQRPNAIEQRSIQQTIRKCELRKIVPLADTTIYQMEQRGEFPKRFNLSPRCVVWSLIEVEDWIERRRQNSKNSETKRAPFPDVRQRKFRPVRT